MIVPSNDRDNAISGYIRPDVNSGSSGEFRSLINSPMASNETPLDVGHKNGVGESSSWTPVTPEKAMNERSNSVSFDIQEKQPEPKNWQDLVGMYMGLLQDKILDTNGVAKDINSTPPPPLDRFLAPHQPNHRPSSPPRSKQDTTCHTVDSSVMDHIAPNKNNQGKHNAGKQIVENVDFLGEAIAPSKDQFRVAHRPHYTRVHLQYQI